MKNKGQKTGRKLKKHPVIVANYDLFPQIITKSIMTKGEKTEKITNMK